MENLRKIKIQPKFLKAGFSKPRRVYPVVTLGGKWMQDAGFQPGKLIEVRVQDGKLTITSASHDRN